MTDINVMLGPYPFRDLVATDVSNICALLGKVGVRAAIVGATPTLLYRDVYRGHRLAFQDIKATKISGEISLYPTLTVNPLSPDWQRDLEETLAGRGPAAGSVGLRLYPSYHQYHLTDSVTSLVAHAAVERKLPLLLTQRIEDRRQRHPWDRASDLSITEVVRFAEKHPGLKLALLNWLDFGPLHAGYYLQMKRLAENACLLIDPTRASVLIRKHLPRLLDTLGIETLAYGSATPFLAAEPTLLKLDLLGLTAAERQSVAWKNASVFFGLQP